MAEDSSFLRYLSITESFHIWASDNDYSISESDCEALIGSSDDDQKSEVHCNVDEKNLGSDRFRC